jgi:hypothetical protein
MSRWVQTIDWYCILYYISNIYLSTVTLFRIGVHSHCVLKLTRSLLFNLLSFTNLFVLDCMPILFFCVELNSKIIIFGGQSVCLIKFTTSMKVKEG